MTRTCCPDCYTPVDVPRHAREGRCAWCRPRPKRAHSEPRIAPGEQLQKFIKYHNRKAA